MKSTAKYWIETFQGRESDSPFFFRIRARNGKIVTPSQGYTRRSSRDRIVASLSREFSIEVRKGLP